MIGVGDQPYYVHGPGYWYRGAYYVWIRDITRGVMATKSGSTAIIGSAD